MLYINMFVIYSHVMDPRWSELAARGTVLLEELVRCLEEEGAGRLQLEADLTALEASQSQHLHTHEERLQDMEDRCEQLEEHNDMAEAHFQQHGRRAEEGAGTNGQNQEQRGNLEARVDKVEESVNKALGIFMPKVEQLLSNYQRPSISSSNSQRVHSHVTDGASTSQVAPRPSTAAATWASRPSTQYVSVYHVPSTSGVQPSPGPSSSATSATRKRVTGCRLSSDSSDEEMEVDPSFDSVSSSPTPGTSAPDIILELRPPQAVTKVNCPPLPMVNIEDNLSTLGTSSVHPESANLACPRLATSVIVQNPSALSVTEANPLSSAKDFVTVCISSSERNVEVSQLPSNSASAHSRPSNPTCPRTAVSGDALDPGTLLQSTEDASSSVYEHIAEIRLPDRTAQESQIPSDRIHVASGSFNHTSPRTAVLGTVVVQATLPQSVAEMNSPSTVNEHVTVCRSPERNIEESQIPANNTSFLSESSILSRTGALVTALDLGVFPQSLTQENSQSLVSERVTVCTKSERNVEENQSSSNITADASRSFEPAPSITATPPTVLGPETLPPSLILENSRSSVSERSTVRKTSKRNVQENQSSLNITANTSRSSEPAPTVTDTSTSAPETETSSRHMAVANSPSPFASVPSLHQAAAQEDVAALQRMLDAGERVDLRDHRGNTPLHVAASNGSVDAAGILLANRTAVDRCGQQGRTALHCAAIQGELAMVELLVGAGANLGLRDGKGATALTLAAAGGHEYVVDFLLRKGADVKKRDKRGRTALHHAVMGDHLGVATRLVENGAVVDAVDVDGDTPLMCAVVNQNVRFVRFLLQKGALPSTSNEDGESPVRVAFNAGYADVLSEMLNVTR